MPAVAVIKLPDSMSHEEASTLQSPGLTAWNAVVEAGAARAGDTVLTLGSGAVSVFGMQWARMLGAQCIMTSSTGSSTGTMSTTRSSTCKAARRSARSSFGSRSAVSDGVEPQKKVWGITQQNSVQQLHAPDRS